MNTNIRVRRGHPYCYSTSRLLLFPLSFFFLLDCDLCCPYSLTLFLNSEHQPMIKVKTLMQLFLLTFFFFFYGDFFASLVYWTSSFPSSTASFPFRFPYKDIIRSKVMSFILYFLMFFFKVCLRFPLQRSSSRARKERYLKKKPLITFSVKVEVKSEQKRG